MGAIATAVLLATTLLKDLKANGALFDSTNPSLVALWFKEEARPKIGLGCMARVRVMQLSWKSTACRSGFHKACAQPLCINLNAIKLEVLESYYTVVRGAWTFPCG